MSILLLSASTSLSQLQSLWCSDMAASFDPPTQPAMQIPASDNADVVFVHSGVTAHWTDSAVSLLELAEQSGLAPEFSCRSGICNTCACRIREGEVEYFEEPLQQPDPGTVLVCCSRPLGRVVLEL